MAITLDGSNASTTGVINSATAKASTSGTSIDFTGIPAGVKRVTVMFNGVSTNGTSIVQIQLGSGSAATSGYLGSVETGASAVNFTSGFYTGQASAATAVRHGLYVFSLISGNIWCGMGNCGQSDGARVDVMGGSVSLSGTLDRVRITTVNGTDAFDAGSINILYE